MKSTRLLLCLTDAPLETACGQIQRLFSVRLCSELLFYRISMVVEEEKLVLTQDDVERAIALWVRAHLWSHDTDTVDSLYSWSRLACTSSHC